jgi:hypothetical protein
MISPRCEVVSANLAEQLEASLKIFRQMIENERVDHLLLPKTFYASRHRLMKTTYARNERRIGV